MKHTNKNGGNKENNRNTQKDKRNESDLKGGALYLVALVTEYHHPELSYLE